MHALDQILDIREMRSVAKRRVPRMFFGYVDSGSWTESTRDSNHADFARLRFRQRIAVNIENRSSRSRILGKDYAMPVVLSPAGMGGMLFPDAEIEAARAAEEANIPYTLSTMSICPIEAVAEAVQSPMWFQLYCMRDREFVDKLIQRARSVQCAALMVTLDLQVLGQRHADIRNSLAAPPRLSFDSARQVMARPRWCWRMLRARHRTFGNIVGHVAGIDGLSQMAEWTASQFDPTLDWDAVRRIRDSWQGPLILKGILDIADAVRAAEIGADAIVVSNHGGRQLDGAPSTVSVLPGIVAAVGKRLDVHIDSGVRSGQDVLRALALGAKAAHIGRPYLYGLAVAGGAGVRRVLNIMQKELDLTMAFCGKTAVAEIGSDVLWHAGYAATAPLAQGMNQAPSTRWAQQETRT